MNKKIIIISMVILLALLAGAGVWKWENIKNTQVSQNDQVQSKQRNQGQDNSEVIREKRGVDVGNNYYIYENKIYYWDEGPQAVSSMIPIDAESSQFKTFASRHCDDKIYKFNNCARYGKDNNKVFLGYCTSPISLDTNLVY